MTAGSSSVPRWPHHGHLPCILPVLPSSSAGGATRRAPPPSFAAPGCSISGTSGAPGKATARHGQCPTPLEIADYQVVAGLVLSFTAFTLLRLDTAPRRSTC